MGSLRIISLNNVDLLIFGGDSIYRPVDTNSYFTKSSVHLNLCEGLIIRTQIKTVAGCPASLKFLKNPFFFFILTKIPKNFFFFFFFVV